MNQHNKTAGFSNLGEFLINVRKYFSGERRDSRLEELVKTALVEGTDSLGGFTVPAQFSTEIFTAAMEGAIVRPLCRYIVPMTSDTLSVPGIVESDRSSYLMGGITVTQLNEAAEMGASPISPAFGRVGLSAHSAEALAFVSNSLEADLGRFGDFVKALFASAIRFYEDHRFIWGTGVGEPLGVMNSDAIIQVTRTNNAGAPTSKDCANMVSRLLPGALKTAVWIVSQNVLADWGVDATSGANAYGAIDLSGMTIFGRPIVVSEKASASGTSGDIILADFAGGYVIGDRGLEIATSREVNYSSGTNGWLKNETCWRFIIRGDGQPILTAAITPYKGGETLSHFVALTTAS
jgi:HK97 family phage major capsid protein